MTKGRKKKGRQGGRLVQNHSTHIPGLLPILDSLAQEDRIKTVVPGRLSRVKGRPTPLKIRVTVPTKGGYKLQARSSGGVQEVFVITDLNAEALQSLIDYLLDIPY
ncbi:DUF2103 domain-containing protein [Anaerolineales bacterium HSG24]|nr:DUF2103 domain-containing protein [Anaerolineales bacterium HSG24]